MKAAITPERIANSIQQDRSFNGYYLFVEGEKDVKLFRKLMCESRSKIKVTFGKKIMREAYEILDKRGFSHMAGIRDADFIRIPRVGKYDEDYSHRIFITDSHDSEGMIINSAAFDDFIAEVAKEKDLEEFVGNHGDVKNFIYRLAYPLACLRLANKVYRLGLSFKPVRPEGNKLKIKKFICEKTLSYLGDEKLVNTVVEYSKNRGSIIAERQFILEKLSEVVNDDLPKIEILNGHDLAEIIYMVCKKGLKSSSENLKCASSVEGMLRLSFCREYFAKTDLYESIRHWESSDAALISFIRD